MAFSSKEADTTCASAASSNGTLTSPYITTSLASADSNSKLASSGHYAQLAASEDFSAIVSSGQRACLASSGRYAMLASAGEGDKLVSAGDESRLVSLGDCAVIASLGFRGSVDVRGKDSVGAAVGRDNKIRGTIGTWITLAEWDFDDDDDTRYVCKCVKSAKIDGKKLKPNTWYQLVDGEFTEVQNIKTKEENE